MIIAWKARHPSVSGHGGAYAMREIVNAFLYQVRTGCQRRYVPHDLLPKSAVYYFFGKWRDDGTAETVHDLLRWQVRQCGGCLDGTSREVTAIKGRYARSAAPQGPDAPHSGPRHRDSYGPPRHHSRDSGEPSSSATDVTFPKGIQR